MFPQGNDLNVQQQGQQNQTFSLNDQQHDCTNLCHTLEHTLPVVELPMYSNRNPPPNLPCMTVYSSPQFYQHAAMSIAKSIQTSHDNTPNRHSRCIGIDTHLQDSDELLRNCYSTFNIKPKKVLLMQYESNIEATSPINVTCSTKSSRLTYPQRIFRPYEDV